MASNHVALVTAGGLTNATIAHSLYGYCTTAAATAAKTVTMYKTGSTAGAAWDAADLFHGLTITVRFQYSNTVASPTLNVNSTGAKPIYRYGTTAPGTSVAASWPAQAVVQLTYDLLLNTSGCWVMNDYKDDNNTTYSAGSGLSLSTTTFNHDSTVTAGTVGTSSATSGKTLAVPYVTYNGTGHITATGTHTHTVSGFANSTHTHVASDITDMYITKVQTDPGTYIPVATSQQSSVNSAGWNILGFYNPNESNFWICRGLISITGINTTSYLVSGNQAQWAPTGNGGVKSVPFLVGSNGAVSGGSGIFPVEIAFWAV